MLQDLMQQCLQEILEIFVCYEIPANSLIYLLYKSFRAHSVNARDAPI